MITCGGCQGLGAHRRWCPVVHGYYASQIGDGSAVLNGVGDLIGANDYALSNRCWALAADLADYARSKSK